jgi:hypothetical protein
MLGDGVRQISAFAVKWMRSEAPHPSDLLSHRYLDAAFGIRGDRESPGKRTVAFGRAPVDELLATLNHHFRRTGTQRCCR